MKQEKWTATKEEIVQTAILARHLEEKATKAGEWFPPIIAVSDQAIAFYVRQQAFDFLLMVNGMKHTMAACREIAIIRHILGGSNAGTC